jgi:hypothetical protein
MSCKVCGTEKWMEFHCVPCCVRWLASMSGAARQINAPVIEAVMGIDHMEAVRNAWKEGRWKK